MLSQTPLFCITSSTLFFEIPRSNQSVVLMPSLQYSSRLFLYGFCIEHSLNVYCAEYFTTVNMITYF